MGTFKALVVDKGETGPSVAFRDFAEADLMEGDVTVRVTHSTVNYKDGLALTGKAPVVRRWPMIPGIDFAGSVETSAHPDFKPGDPVVLNGWGTGETHLGAYAQKARVKGDWLVPLPAGLTPAQAMAIGTAGYTAMLCVLALERHGLKPGDGPVVVTGAAGGVGSVAIALLAKAGWHVIASTGRPEEADYLKGLGAAEIIDRAELSGPAGRSPRSAGRPASTRSARTRSPTCSSMTKYGGADRRLRAGRRHGPAVLGRALHPARRRAARRRLRDGPEAAAARGLDPPRHRPRPGQARGHDDDDPAGQVIETGARSSRARCGAGWSSRSPDDRRCGKGSLPRCEPRAGTTGDVTYRLDKLLAPAPSPWWTPRRAKARSGAACRPTSVELAMCRKLGFAVRSDPSEADVMEVKLSVAPEPAQLSA